MIFKAYIPRTLFFAFLTILVLKGYFIFSPAISGLPETKNTFIGPIAADEFQGLIEFSWEKREIITEDEQAGYCQVDDYKTL